MSIEKLKAEAREIEARMERLEEEIAEKEAEMENFDKEDYVDEDDYAEMLDDVYGDVEIAGFTYGTAYALKELDPTAYRIGFAEWVDARDYDDFEEYRDLVDELDTLNDDLMELDSLLDELDTEIGELMEEEV